MATANNTPVNNTWDNAEVIDGLDILDKSQLEGVEFRITGCLFQEGSQAVIAYIDGERRDGYAFTFTDSSTGVKAQLIERLTAKGLDAAVETGEYVELNLIAPNGLRLSTYQVPERGPNGQPIPGKFRTAKTYYLTTSGKRTARDAGKNATPAKRTPAAK